MFHERKETLKCGFNDFHLKHGSMQGPDLAFLVSTVVIVPEKRSTAVVLTLMLKAFHAGSSTRRRARGSSGTSSGSLSLRRAVLNRG